MRSLEGQSSWLSEDASPPGSGKIYNLCETLMEDLNNYAECMIPIDEINTLNIMLFPTLSSPAQVRAWHVPLFTVRIETVMDDNWDLTMQRVIPFINGVNSVKNIAALADADLKLTRECVRHLLYYGCVLLLDIFSFNNIYAPTAEFTNMIASDTDMQAECARYVNTAFEPSQNETAAGSVAASISLKSGLAATADLAADDDIWPLTGRRDVVDGVSVVQLYACLRQGLSIREWYIQNTNMLANIDLRRFITFGVIKGFLYRVHRQEAQPSPTNR
ncbi:Nitrogen permease regulator 2 [Elasticomyces elasticus]|nr:Nitrogen permease regulator 2 [Elasticomyces elasticus]